MFKKILIAEDLDSINLSIIQTMEQIEIPEVHHSKYCDEALIKLKKALQENAPFDLLISDLSFKADHRDETLKSGQELIEAIKKIQPSIKIIVFSVEDKSYKIKSLFENSGINAYILKGRNSIPELKKAMEHIYNHDDLFLSAELRHILQKKLQMEIESYDIKLLAMLCKGLPQEDIAQEFKNSGITPSSISAIEKRISKLKIYFKANNNIHLIAIAKDLGVV